MTCTTIHLTQAGTVVFGPLHALNRDTHGCNRAPSRLNDPTGRGADAVAALCLHPRRG